MVSHSSTNPSGTPSQSYPEPHSSIHSRTGTSADGRRPEAVPDPLFSLRSKRDRCDMHGQGGAIVACVSVQCVQGEAPGSSSALTGVRRPAAPVRPAIFSFPYSKQMKMDSKRGCSFSNLTNDLVVEILSRLPFKSFCRFKCVCKAWLNFSSDPYYSQKLPKIPSGFFYQDDSNSDIEFISLSLKDEGIDLSFLPQHAHLNFVDCSSGLVLCEYRSNSTSPDIFRFIVCNPATREWKVLPDAQRDPENFYYRTILAFDPSRSPHFCVFHFPHERSPDGSISGFGKVEMFSSPCWTWLEDYAFWVPENGWIVDSGGHVFLDNILYVRFHENDFLGDFLALEELYIGMPPPSQWTFKSPLQRPESIVDSYGCLGHASGILYYAAPEKDGCTIVVWSYAGIRVRDPKKRWTVKHHLSMKDAFGRDDFVHYDDVSWSWCCDYNIVAIDLEREVLFLFEYKTQKLLSYNIVTGKLNSIRDGHQWYKYYVPWYSKIPGPDPYI